MPYETESAASAAYMKSILRNLGLDALDLAELLNLHPTTIEKWLRGTKIDMGCAHVLLDLLWRHPEEMVDLLAARKGTFSELRDWPARIAEVQWKLGITRMDFLSLLHTSDDVLRRYEEGRKEPAGCYAVLLDILYDHPEKFVTLMGWEPTPDVPETTEWTKKGLQTLLARLSLTTHDLAHLLHLKPSSILEWMYGWSAPGHCAALFLGLLDFFPVETLQLLQDAEPDDPDRWTGNQVRKLRETLGFGPSDFADLLGMDYDTLRLWERDGLPSRSDCPRLLYTILRTDPDALVPLLERLRS